MHIYNGKFTQLPYAANECITFVVPGGFALNDPFCAYWQWTQDDHGNKKAESSKLGAISSTSKTDKEYRFTVDYQWYAFDIVMANSDFRSMKVTMRDPRGVIARFTLHLHWTNSVEVPSGMIYAGRLDWQENAQNELAILVFPSRIANGEPACLFFQWTMDNTGKRKRNHSVTGMLRSVHTIASTGETNGVFDDGMYIFSFTMRVAYPAKIVFRMSNSSAEARTQKLYEMRLVDYRTMHKKKGLIFRYGPGSERDLIMLRDMLTNFLGFHPRDVEMFYFDDGSPEGPKRCTQGQRPPTLAHFKEELVKLLASAATMEAVRFLYVDARGVGRPRHRLDEVQMDEGWVLAGDGSGLKEDVVWHDWISDVIRENLKPGINFTIISSSGVSSDALETYNTVPGIFLTGCHETQSTSKNPEGLDPWLLAITAVMAQQVERHHGVPTYSVLFNEAKTFIQQQVTSGESGSGYKGPSPDETAPIPYIMVNDAMYQDPQMVFNNEYVDVNEERFLTPFSFPNDARTRGTMTRYPRDEYPDDEHR